MEHRDARYPKSRTSGVLVDHVRDETIVYDEDRQEAHALNRTAGLVWTNSDGTRSVSDIAALLGTELGIEASDSLVEYTLDELSRVHLLESAEAGAEVSGAMSRRDAFRRLTLAGAAAFALPVVLSVVAPTPAMAASGSTQNGQGQNNNNQGGNQQ